jgi:hypothetical protein
VTTYPETGLVATTAGATGAGTAISGGASTGGREPTGTSGVGVAAGEDAADGCGFPTVTLRAGGVVRTAVGGGVLFGGGVAGGVAIGREQHRQQ